VCSANAQCCCTNIVLLIPVDHLQGVLGERAFEVKETRGQYTFHRVDKDSTDGVLHLFLDAGCGLRDTHLEITRTTTGERMALSVLFVGFDGWHPGLRIPFRSGVFEVDLERMIGCAGLDHRWDRAAADTLSPAVEEVGCGGCRLRVERSGDGVWLEPLDLWPGGCSAGSVEGDAYGKASYPEGQLLFRTAVEDEQAKDGARGVPAHRPWSGYGVVGANGSFHARMDQEQTQRIYQLEMSLMKVQGWRPAWVPDPQAPGGRRDIGSMVRFTLDRLSPR
jgi:hypothetical protein